MGTRQFNLSAVTLQVQLCEYRQFRHSLARNSFGLPDDQTMRVESAGNTKLHADDFIEYDKKRGCAKFDFPKKIPFEVPKVCGQQPDGGRECCCNVLRKVCSWHVQGRCSEVLQRPTDRLQRR